MVVFFRYEKKIKTPPGGAMILGTSLHAALEHNFSQKVLSHRDVPMSVATDVFREKWREGSVNAIFDPEKNESADKFLEQGIAMVETYHRDMAPNIQPKFVELKFTLNFPGLDREVLGYIDLIDDREIIIDHKSSKMVPKNIDLAKNNQLTLYKMAFRERYGREPGGLRYDYIVRRTNKDGSFKGVDILPIPVISNAAKEQSIVNLYKVVADSMALKQYFPNPSHFGCTPTFCGYWDLCEGRRMAGERVEFYDELHEMRKAAYKRLIQTGKP